MAFAQLSLLEKFRKGTATIILQPSPGLPKLVDGRWLFMASPEYWATSPARP